MPIVRSRSCVNCLSNYSMVSKRLSEYRHLAPFHATFYKHLLIRVRTKFSWKPSLPFAATRALFVEELENGGEPFTPIGCWLTAKPFFKSNLVHCWERGDPQNRMSLKSHLQIYPSTFHCQSFFFASPIAISQRSSYAPTLSPPVVSLVSFPQ